MTHLSGQHADRQQEWEGSVAAARAGLRAERKQITDDRTEADRLLAEARTARRQAIQFRARARGLARRFVQRVNHEQEAIRQRLADESAAVNADRERLASQVAAVEKMRSEFVLTAAAARDRLRDAWIMVRAQQKRAVNEWAEADRQTAEETARLDARDTEIKRQEKKAADVRARTEAEVAGLREEAAALETRIANARESLAELERRRDVVRAEMQGVDAPEVLLEAEVVEGDSEPDAASDLPAGPDASAVRKTDDDSSADRRRLADEQLGMLVEARIRWQRAERDTVREMEQLAEVLRQRERDLETREERLIRSDRRRREEAYDLWQLRLHLESWQSKLTAFELQWHTEREQLEADFQRRTTLVSRRETELETTFSRWDAARTRERERLRAELELWTDDRKRLTDGAADLDRHRNESAAETARHAARAVAAEERLAEVQGVESGRSSRRLAVLQRRWEWVFARRTREIEHRRTELSTERAAIDDRYRELHRLLVEVAEREAAANHRLTANLDLEHSILQQLPARMIVPAHSSPDAHELEGLRTEVERVASFMVEMELPEPLDPPPAELPWAEEAPPAAELIPFDNGARAA